MGYHCAVYATETAWSRRKRLIEECRSCGRQHVIVAALSERTGNGFARWLFSTHPVTSSKDGPSAMELQWQLGFAGYGTAPACVCRAHSGRKAYRVATYRRTTDAPRTLGRRERVPQMSYPMVFTMAPPPDRRLFPPCAAEVDQRSPLPSRRMKAFG